MKLSVLERVKLKQDSLFPSFEEFVNEFVFYYKRYDVEKIRELSQAHYEFLRFKDSLTDGPLSSFLKSRQFLDQVAIYADNLLEDNFNEDVIGAIQFFYRDSVEYWPDKKKLN